ncbi:hypothetical protein ACX818_001415 [Acinetobacter baumannii]
MRSLNNLRKIVPTWFKQFIDTNRPHVEICQVVEFKDYFMVMTFDVAEEVYLIGTIDKPSDARLVLNPDYDEYSLINTAEQIDESEMEDDDEEILNHYDIKTLEDYANYRFAQELGIEGL